MSTDGQMLGELESLSEFRKVNAQFPYNEYVRKWQDPQSSIGVKVLLGFIPPVAISTQFDIEPTKACSPSNEIVCLGISWQHILQP